MSTLFVIAVTAIGMVIAIARRHAVAVVLVGVQSVALGAYALAHGFDETSELVIGGALLVGKGILLPLGLAGVVRRTREGDVVRWGTGVPLGAGANVVGLGFSTPLSHRVS